MGINSDLVFAIRKMKNGKTRVAIYLTPAEIKAAESIAKQNGLRTINQWIVTVVLRALVIR